MKLLFGGAVARDVAGDDLEAGQEQKVFSTELTFLNIFIGLAIRHVALSLHRFPSLAELSRLEP